ncbi:GAP family protein [Halomarina pelagica]|uniref:GAP family protein n=1 Tax=Halomarina pelagica TaxID=2961599 RepID=UPI0020C39115|nr:GAP family protein [Halomarina sp. BND7]
MDAALITALFALALIDSTSLGTLFIPIWLLLQPKRVTTSRLLTYLTTIAGFYFVIGIALMMGAASLAQALTGVLDRTTTLYLQLAIGIGLVVLSGYFWLRQRLTDSADKTDRWQTRVADQSSSTRGIAGLALLAGVLELTMMLPYLGAIGMLTTSDIGWSVRILLLSGYALIMIVPALVLFVIRSLVHEQVEPWLERLNKWIGKQADEATVWVPAVVGFLVVYSAAGGLGWVEPL